jgi:hypothetical protein
MIMPRVEKRPGSQSGKVTWTGTGSYGASGDGEARPERIAASRKVHQPIANCERAVREGERGGWLARRQHPTHKCTAQIDTPFPLARPEIEPGQGNETDPSGVVRGPR